MTQNKRYSRYDLLMNIALGNLFGGLVGVVQGVVGSFAVPTSLRRINTKLDADIRETFGNNREKTVGDRAFNFTYHYTRISTRIGIHATAMYRMTKDLSDGGDINYGLLIVPNLISTGYEIYRVVKNKKAVNEP